MALLEAVILPRLSRSTATDKSRRLAPTEMSLAAVESRLWMWGVCEVGRVEGLCMKLNSKFRPSGLNRSTEAALAAADSQRLSSFLLGSASGSDADLACNIFQRSTNVHHKSETGPTKRYCPVNIDAKCQ